MACRCCGGKGFLELIEENRLTPQQGDILDILKNAGGAWVTRDELARRLYIAEDEPPVSAISVLRKQIHDIRRKLGANVIESVQWRGYRIGGDYVVNEVR